MGKKPRMGLFASIKYDWQEWANDQNIVKKIFWFIWLVIWTILRCLFGIIGYIWSHSPNNKNTLEGRAHLKGMSTNEYRAWLKEQKEIHGNN
jgi:hypothetical protein